MKSMKASGGCFRTREMESFAANVNKMNSECSFAVRRPKLVVNLENLTFDLLINMS